MYVVITDCIPNYAETDDVDSIMFTLDGQAKSTRLSNSRPAIPTNFEEWFAGASVLCRAREFFNPALLTSNNAYIEWVRQLYRSYSPATVYEDDAAWRSYCSIDNISFWPISPHFMKGAIILQRGCLLVSARSHCIHCQAVTHTSKGCPLNSRMFVPSTFYDSSKSHVVTVTPSTDRSRSFRSFRSFRPFQAHNQNGYPQSPQVARAASNDKPCRFHNKSSGCKYDAETCLLRHICSICKRSDHGASSCPTKVARRRPPITY